MSRKKFNYAWVKGKKKFYGQYGTKTDFALDLLIMGDIKLNKKDYIKLDIRNHKEICRIQSHEAEQILLEKGWKWKKVKELFVF